LRNMIWLWNVFRWPTWCLCDFVSGTVWFLLYDSGVRLTQYDDTFKTPCFFLTHVALQSLNVHTWS